MTDHPTPSPVDELRQAIFNFDKSRGQTGADYVTGKITRQQADSEFEDDIQDLMAVLGAKITEAYEKGRNELPRND